MGYFWNIFKAQENLSIIQQLDVIRVYPRIFSEEEGKKIVDHVLISKVLTTLTGFVVSKSSGYVGWTVESFLEFFLSFGA